MPARFHRRRVLTHEDFMRFGGVEPAKKPKRRGKLPSLEDVQRARWGKTTTMQISTEVLTVLSGLEIAGNTIKMQKLERGLYLKVDAVLKEMGGTWNRKAQAHVFAVDPSPIVEQVLTVGEITTAKDLGFFRTPQPLAKRLVELADVRPGHVVLEPSAGDGAIVRELIAVDAGVFAIERDDQRRRQLFSMARECLTLAVAHEVTDFMEYETDEPFDRVVMNPPFCKVGLGDHLDHVHHAFSMLVPGGVLVSVLPAGVKFRTDKRHREFREWCAEEVPDASMIFQDLPEGAFKESGTGVRTVLLRLVKR